VSEGAGPGSAFEIAAAVRSRDVSAVDIAAVSLGAVEARNGELNALTQVFHEHAMEQARGVDARIASGEGAKLPLAGVPVALKDNICLSWGFTTAGSRMLEGYRSPFNATAAERLLAAGAVVIGKANLDEFAMGSSTEHSAFGPTRNPVDPSRVPGGSSGGSAAAVGAGMAPVALGSDTGGSIRQPAGLCGVVGFKPTYGRVSRWGLIAYASSLDQIGPLTTNVRDAALVTEVIAGADARDATCSTREAPKLVEDLEKPIEKLRVGVLKLHQEGHHPAVDDAMAAAKKALEDAGAELVEAELPLVDHGVAAYYIIALAEASSNLSRYDGVRYGRRADLGLGEGLRELYVKSRTEGFGAEVRRRIMLGTHVLSSGYYDAYYTKALKARRLIKRDYDRVFEGGESEGLGCHALLMPVSPGPAFRIGEKVDDPLAMYLEDVYTVGVNLAGLPAVSLKAGDADEGRAKLPIGVQVVGKAFEDGVVLRVGRVIEKGLEGPRSHDRGSDG
jgi:aspartyl-tRNA(Asn)/glutamyl-tRNA(Gln) amidotransferase subunit A